MCSLPGQNGHTGPEPAPWESSGRPARDGATSSQSPVSGSTRVSIVMPITYDRLGEAPAARRDRAAPSQVAYSNDPSRRPRPMNQPNVSKHTPSQPAPTAASANAWSAAAPSRPSSTSRTAISPWVSGRNRDTHATGVGYADSGTLTPHSVITVTRPTLATRPLSSRKPSSTPPRNVPKQYAEAPTSTVSGTTSRLVGLATSSGSVPVLRSQLTMFSAQTPSIAASIVALPTSRNQVCSSERSRRPSSAKNVTWASTRRNHPPSQVFQV